MLNLVHFVGLGIVEELAVRSNKAVVSFFFNVLTLYGADLPQHMFISMAWD